MLMLALTHETRETLERSRDSNLRVNLDEHVQGRLDVHLSGRARGGGGINKTRLRRVYLQVWTLLQAGEKDNKTARAFSRKTSPDTQQAP